MFCARKGEGVHEIYVSSSSCDNSCRSSCFGEVSLFMHTREVSLFMHIRARKSLSTSQTKFTLARDVMMKAVRVANQQFYDLYSVFSVVRKTNSRLDRADAFSSQLFARRFTDTSRYGIGSTPVTRQPRHCGSKADWIARSPEDMRAQRPSLCTSA